MFKADLTIQKAQKIPLLGVKVEPSPYIIIDCEGIQYTTPIAKYSQNPIWNFHTIIAANKVTSFVQFYIYNNNPNAVDQLLAFGQMEFGDLLTMMNTESKLRLVNSQQLKINSFLYLIHYDFKPPDIYLPLSDRSCLKLNLMNELPKNTEFICQYGDHSFNLSKQLNQNTFRYNSKQDRIRCILRKTHEKDGRVMQNCILIGNIGENTFLTVKFYDYKQDYVIYISASVVINGLLPDNYNIISTKIVNISKSNGKNINCKLKIYGPLNQSMLIDKSQAQIYVENNSLMLIEYFEQIDVVQGVEPYCTFKVPVNSINWSKKLQAQQVFKYFDNFRNLQTSIQLNFQLKQNNELSKIIPKPCNPETLFDEDSTIIVEQIKLNNCFLYEVIGNSLVAFVHVNQRGFINSFVKFTIQQKKTEYIIESKACLENGGKGFLYLISLDQKFADKQTRNIEDSIIFRINVQKSNGFEMSKMDFSSKFLAFAKKASVVNICKKFNQMVHDDLMQLKVKGKYVGDNKRGILKIINIRCIGQFGKALVGVGIDSVFLNSFGQINNFMLLKPYRFYISEGHAELKITLTNTTDNDNSITSFGTLCDFFGTPTEGKLYQYQIKISQVHKLQILYVFQSGQKLSPVPLVKLNPLNFLSPENCLNIQLKRAFVINNRKYRFQITRGNYIYQSFQYATNNGRIYFPQSEVVMLNLNKEQVSPVFINAYSHNQEGNFIIYNGFIDVKEFLGKGLYQVALLHEKQDKKSEIRIVLSVLHNAPSFQSALLVKINKITVNSIVFQFRNIHKYYLAAIIKGFMYDVYQCSAVEQSLMLDSTITVRKGDYINFQLYTSYKAISKQLFSSSEKELIGSKQIIWESIEQNGIFQLNFYNKKENQLRLTKNSLILQQSSTIFLISYSASTFKEQPRIQLLRQKTVHTQVDVLGSGVVKLFFQNYYAISIEAKIISIQIKPINLQIAAQSRLKINKYFYLMAENMQFDLQACITLKEGDKFKKITTKSRVNLRGNHVKINQLSFLKIVFQDYFYLTANFIVYYNKFTNLPRGTVNIKQIQMRGLKIDRFALNFVTTQQNAQNSQNIIKKQGISYNGETLVTTTSALNYLLLFIEGKKSKTKELIYLSEMGIDIYEGQCIYQKEILINGQSLIITIKLNYLSIKVEKKADMTLQYKLQTSKQVKSATVNYTIEDFNRFNTNASIKSAPKKSKGVVVVISIPYELSDSTKQIHIPQSNNTFLKLQPTIVNNLQYVYYSNKILQIQSIKLVNKQYTNKSIQCLGSNKGISKFMVDQNPKLICELQQRDCYVSDIGKESWIARIQFHKIITLGNKRLLSLKNTPNDEILTKQLAIMIKHGKQVKIIRHLNQYGVAKMIGQIQYQFGFDNTCNLLEFYLVIDNYFNQSNQQIQINDDNWIQILPVSYGVINLSNIQEQSLLGCELKPLKNMSSNLQRALNDMIVRQEDMFFLFNLQFQKKSWGFITIKLQNSTGLAFSNQQKNVYVYYRVEVENSTRSVLQSCTTEARLVSPCIEFTNNVLQFLFIQEGSQSHYNLKITGYILSSTNSYPFIQKRQDISDYLQKRENKEINIQIKASQTNNLCKNTHQLALIIGNSMQPTQKQNLIQKAKNINSVDALSFRQIGTNQFFERLLGCQQLTHFNECLQEIKQSYIYLEDPQIDSFVYLIEYLSFDFDAKLIGTICQIIHLNILKCPQIVAQMQQKQINIAIYHYFKNICQKEKKKVPSKVIKIQNKEYLEHLNKFKESKNMATLKNVVEKQAYLLYTPDQLLGSISSRNNEAILNIINVLLKGSKSIRSALSHDISQWIEIFGFADEQNEFELFILLLKNSLLNGIVLEQNLLKRWIDILLQKEYNLSMVYEFWQKIQQREQRLNYYQNIIGKYEKVFQNSCVETCRGVKMMASSLYESKDGQVHQRLVKTHSKIVNFLICNIEKTSEIMLISTHLDLLTYLYEQKLINQSYKNELSRLIKDKLAILKDSSSKLILSNFSGRLNKSSHVKVVSGKKEGLAQEMANKAGFYKKYLITSD